MPIVADSYRFVVGVDTHAKTHWYVIIDTSTGREIDSQEFPTSRSGMKRAVGWIGRRTDHATDQTLISAEGTGSYGARLARLLADCGFRVVDAPSPKRNRGKDKNDRIDAVIAARDAVHRELDKLADIRGGETQATLKILLNARDQMTRERTRAINTLTALLRTIDLGVDARRKPGRPVIRTIAGWRPRNEPTSLMVARTEAVRLARRILDLDIDVRANQHHLQEIITAEVPELLDMIGIGPVNAAIVLSVWSHPGRIRSQAAFAKIGGVCPIEVSSGDTENHRLNRGGDRQLNRALHGIARTRMQHDPQTRAYIERRTHEGKTKPRIRRCLKRYIARELHRTLTQLYTRRQPTTAA